MRRKVTRAAHGMALFVLWAHLGCQTAATTRRLNQFEQRAATDDVQLDSLAVRVETFEATVGELTDLYGEADRKLEEARLRYERASAHAKTANEANLAAAKAYEAAARNWKLITIAILAAASYDLAGHLCATRMSTSAFRRELREQGIDLTGLDVDHGLPYSRGGADHPLNFRMIESGLNRSLGNDVLRKLLAHPTHLLQGALISGLMRLKCSPHL